MFVTRVVASTTQMDVQNLPMRPSRPGGSARSYHGKPALTRGQIARRVAALLPDGATVNLGAGLPALVANFLRERAVILHSENGMLNYGEFVHGSSFDPDLHDASGHFVTVRDGASFFDSVTSFEIARSGRLDAVVLGAYQVGANGDLANWSVPGMTGGGIGGAMDLAVGARQVIAMCEHTDSTGQPKLVGTCDFEVTAPGCVDTVVTDLALLRRTGLTAGLLDNAKPNGSVLLSHTGRELRRQHGIRDFVMYQKGYFGTPVEESLIQQILHNCDSVPSMRGCSARPDGASPTYGSSCLIMPSGPGRN